MGPPIFGVDMETLKKGGENIKEWYKDTIFPEAIEGGVDIIQNIFGAQDLGDGTLPADQQTGTVAPTVDPRKQSGLSEEQDKEIDLADRPPSIVEDVSFKTKVDETKNKVIETVDEIKETVIEKFPEIKRMRKEAYKIPLAPDPVESTYIPLIDPSPSPANTPEPSAPAPLPPGLRRTLPPGLTSRPPNLPTLPTLPPGPTVLPNPQDQEIQRRLNP